MNNQNKINSQVTQPPRRGAGVDLNNDRLGFGSEKLRRLITVLCLGITALAFTPSLLAQVKGLYYGGLGYEFRNNGADLTVEARYWDTQHNEWGLKWSQEWGQQPSMGSLGGCVFNGLLYCFFTTTDGKLQYVTVDPGSQAKTGPTTIATQLPIAPGEGSGAAAAVCGDAIYVFTPTFMGFMSKDGKNFTLWDYNENTWEPMNILDAVAFYPAGDDPAGIMLVYNDGNYPPVLRASIFSPPAQTSTKDFVLPWPPVTPCLWAPVSQGNLVLGTSDDRGAKAPCVQFYGMTADNGCDGQHLGRWEYNLANQTWAFYNWDQGGGSLYQLGVFPWFDTMDSTSGMMRLSHILDVQYGNTEIWYTARSDWMVPQHNDPTYGWDGVPTVTSTATGDTDIAKMLRSLWSLVGIVLGPPPFALNGAADGSGLSQVQYGIDLSQSVTTTETASQTITVGMNNKIKGGLGQVTLDLSYAHGWTSSHGTTHTVDVSTFYTFGPMDETPPDQGTHGWAIFNAPTFVTQWYKVYAYDYNQSTSSGTYLNQDIYATSIGAVVPQTAYFTLANPADGAISNLFQGFPVYPNSTDIAHWCGIRDWNNGGSDWTAIFGDQSNPAVGTLNVGTGITQTYSQTDSTMNSKGNNNSFSITAGASINFFGGFSSGVTVGYDSTFGTQTEIDSTITKSVSCSLNMPIPTPGTNGYVRSMTTQPYWLQAKTANAPWVPTGYGGNLPWLITWDVLGYSTAGTSAGLTMGTAPPPLSALGKIRTGKGNEDDTYKVGTGHLAWLDPSGLLTSLGMTADQFDPALGAAVFLNGHAFSADGSKGKWERKGDVWNYRTRGGPKTETFTLGLDLANKTWSFDGAAKSLDQEIKAGDDSLRVELDVQGAYGFAHWLKHDVAATWSHEEKQAARDAYGVHGIEGAYNSQTGVGHLKLEGQIPKHVSSFGDLEFRVNDASVLVPLLALNGFLHDLTRGRNVKYKAQGLSFEIDFGTGKWKATVEGDRFNAGMAPHGGIVRVQILVGGERRSDQTFQVENYTVMLNYPY